MKSYVTSDGVLVVEEQNSTELFALKNISKILLKEQSGCSILCTTPQSLWSKLLEVP